LVASNARETFAPPDSKVTSFVRRNMKFNVIDFYTKGNGEFYDLATGKKIK